MQHGEAQATTCEPPYDALPAAKTLARDPFAALSSMKAKDLMATPVVSVRDDANLREVARIMVERDIGSVLVTDARGDLVGIVTEKDFIAKEHQIPFSTLVMPRLFEEWVDKGSLEEIYRKAERIRVTQVMSRPVRTVTEDQPMEDVVQIMLQHGVKRVVVVRGTKPVGIVAHRDVLRMAVEKAKPRTFKA